MAPLLKRLRWSRSNAQREKKARGIKSSTNDTVLRFTRTHPTAVRPDACYSRPKRRAAALESPTRTAPVSSRQRPSPRPSAEPSARRTLLLQISVSPDGDSHLRAEQIRRAPYASSVASNLSHPLLITSMIQFRTSVPITFCPRPARTPPRVSARRSPETRKSPPPARANSRASARAARRRERAPRCISPSPGFPAAPARRFSSRPARPRSGWVW